MGNSFRSIKLFAVVSISSADPECMGNTFIHKKVSTEDCPLQC